MAGGFFAGLIFGRNILFVGISFAGVFFSRKIFFAGLWINEFVLDRMKV